MAPSLIVSHGSTGVLTTIGHASGMVTSEHGDRIHTRVLEEASQYTLADIFRAYTFQKY